MPEIDDHTGVPEVIQNGESVIIRSDDDDRSDVPLRTPESILVAALEDLRDHGTRTDLNPTTAMIPNAPWPNQAGPGGRTWTDYIADMDHHVRMAAEHALHEYRQARLDQTYTESSGATGYPKRDAERFVMITIKLPS